MLIATLWIAQVKDEKETEREKTQLENEDLWRFYNAIFFGIWVI